MTDDLLLTLTGAVQEWIETESEESADLIVKLQEALAARYGRFW